ncbi:hypothetical protein GGH94_003067 [Coemansia aciculifera]|uniref:Peptidase S1 domain-containing protein n=1 Tax=Coemansia aciculifera TaxID=417176 RepID=A0A9W8II42_9FUNG|nr:hypothetical protein GGH94_003067 [Coemansia aciculifera]
MYTLTVSSCVAAILAASAIVSSTVIPEGKFPKRELADVAPRIIGGQPAPSTAFQYISYIEGSHPVYGGSACTGSLIAPNVVLTAAHCVYASETVKYTAAQLQVGFTHTTPDPTVLFKGYSVSRIITHPSFSMRTLRSDIALLILSSNIPDATATKAKILTGSYDAAATVTAAGFGLIDPYSKTAIADVLMQVDLNLGATSFCRSNSPGFDPNYVLCTDGKAGKDTCNGDSGGPLAIPTKGSPDGTALLGLTSFGPISAKNPDGLCAQAGIPGYYTRISPYVPWIAQSANLDAESFTVAGSGSGPNPDISSSSKPSSSKSSTTKTSKTSTRTTPTADDDKTDETPTDDGNDNGSISFSKPSHSPLFPPPGNGSPASSGSSSLALAVAVLGSVAAFVAA